MSRAEQAWGSNNPDTLFGESSTVAVPWPIATRKKTEPLFDRDKVAEAVRANHSEPTDPRNLTATQGQITYAGVRHYMSNPAEVYKDQHQAGNRNPVVYHRGEESLLLSGHHRATSALLQGRQFDAIHVR